MQTSKAADLTASIHRSLDELARLTDEARISTTLQTYLETCARFYPYSIGNQILIWLARPDATHVAGYNDWLHKFKRYVRKGEKGIAILAPCFTKGTEGEKDRLYFRTVYVFDVSQTEGEPLPEPPNWRSPARSASLQAALLAYAASLGIEVSERELAGSTQGYRLKGAIVLSPTAGTKTLIHELAHELLHQRSGSLIDRASREHEAEAVAYVVARHFGLEDLNSPNYLALWNADSKVLQAAMNRISACAKNIINGANPPQPEPDDLN